MTNIIYIIWQRKLDYAKILQAKYFTAKISRSKVIVTASYSVWLVTNVVFLLSK